jgi:hypothetical protein
LTDVNVFHFALQNNNALINVACLCDANARNKSEFKINKSQCSKANSTFKGIGRVNDIEEVLKICANLCTIQCATIDVQGGGFPFLHKFGVKIILCIRNPVFQCWHAKNASKLSHSHYIFMQKLHHVSTQLAKFSSNSKNTNLVKHGKSTFDIKIPSAAIKYVSSFLVKMEEYVAEDSVPTNVPSFYQGIITSMKPVDTVASKSMAPRTGIWTKSAKDEPNKKK